ncbi:hypothetical protein CAEBREN_12627 [Caenorhabditis brenneri]|uniref:Uncharacterized protein n=1 Tax=Caenorhabditis brenneri TaxID=135651 RepID=G0NB74_CAEBE|nr:hypothetical protein CAEBREN_12627 [Caenorhabditis brenneri]
MCRNTSTTGHVILTVTEKCQKDMDRVKKNHAQEIQRMKERYEELEKQNEECIKVFEGLKAVQEKKKMYDGTENGTMSSKIVFIIFNSSIVFPFDLIKCDPY